MHKVVYSRTLKEVKETKNWKNVKLLHEVDSDDIKKMKKEPGKDLTIFGSNNLCTTLLEKGLRDEVRIIVNPVVLGKGNSLFTGIEKKLKLKLLKTREFKSGNVLLTYKPE